MADVDVEATRIYRRLVDDLLDRAERVKPDKQIEPPLTEAQLGESIWQVQGDDAQVVVRMNQQTQFAAVEIAFREKFYSVLATTSIDDPGFIQIWNLLDIVSIFSDNEQCEPGLIFWQIEELLDSQTIDGCRKVFDYLESRRERNTKKHFKQKSLVILRSCNELLRRLSRAEDTVFCGRVFIFLFQSFPLGDKSAVNLRGEYHTENVTTFDENTKTASKENEGADIEMTDQKESEDQKAEKDTQQPSGDQEAPKTPKVVVSDNTNKEAEKKVDLDALYPMFWGLQAYFSAPTRMFDPQHFATFRTGLESTLSTFKNIKTDLESQSSKSAEELRKAMKRKRTPDDTEIASSFNPKYLTSRDLFDLEINDTAFRRHVLVQALILLDFMLSLTPKAKGRLADLTNKSVLYGFVLSDEDAKWATKMRKAIEDYLQEGAGGKFYYRMVDTVLSRDKNWVRWKAEGCPLIERPPVSVSEYVAAREQASKTYSNKRLRPSPMGSLNLKFLSEGEALASLDRLKEPNRFNVPTADSFMMGIMDDELDIDMAQSKEEKDNALRSKASKTWRILRLSSRNKLAAFDKIDDGKNLKALFEDPSPPESEKGAGTSQSQTQTQTQTQTSAPEQAQTQEQNQDQAPEQTSQEQASAPETAPAPEQTSSQEQTSAPEEASAPAPEQTMEEVATETKEGGSGGNNDQGHESTGGEAITAVPATESQEEQDTTMTDQSAEANLPQETPAATGAAS